MTAPLPSFTSGQVPTAANLNAIGSNLRTIYDSSQGGFLTDRPMVCVTITRENLEFPTNTERFIEWDIDEIDTDHMWSPLADELLRANTAGVYRVGLSLALQPLTVATNPQVLAARISRQLDGVLSTSAITAGFGSVINGIGGSAYCSTTVTLEEGEGVNAWITHTAGATAALDPLFGSCRFWAIWLGPLP